MYEQDFDGMTLEEIIKYAQLDLDPLEQFDEFELEEMVEWLKLEQFDEADIITKIEEELNNR